MTKKAVLVCLIGIDGSGKTTLAGQLVCTLNERYKSTFKYVHAMVKPIFFRRITRLGKLIFKNTIKENDYNSLRSAKRDLFSSHVGIARLYSSLTFLETVPQLLLMVAVPLFSRFNIIADRYFMDIIVDLALYLKLPPSKIERLLRHYGKFLPTPDVVLHIDVPPEVAFKRKDDIPTIGYLEERRAIYDSIAKYYNAQIFDGTKSTSILQSVILDQLEEAGIVL